jgi:mRNA interferase YafQ
MRTINFSNSFRRDFKRELKGRFGPILDDEIRNIVEILANDQLLPPRYRDHALIGDWRDHRDCHIRPDLVLIYRKPDETTLELVRLGSHSELGL